MEQTNEKLIVGFGSKMNTLVRLITFQLNEFEKKNQWK